MNIKIKASGVACMVGDDYDRVYKALVKSFGEGSSNLFSKRVAGHEYLQWEIPGDGWRSLSEADPFIYGSPSEDRTGSETRCCNQQVRYQSANGFQCFVSTVG